MSAASAFNRLAKWRVVFAGWQLGTRPSSDPESAAVRDAREALLILRAEMTAVTAILVEHGIVTPELLERYMEQEANALSASLEERFPGAHATDLGMEFGPRAAEWLKDFPK